MLIENPTQEKITKNTHHLKRLARIIEIVIPSRKGNKALIYFCI
jgi:hypothetical protein